MEKVGILLVNLGTPNDPGRKSVKKYLAEFLMDGRVIDIPFWKRFLLVRGIIAPFRSKKVSKEYKKLWLPEGSPLWVYGKALTRKLQVLFDQGRPRVFLKLAMRYQNPSIGSVLDELRGINVDRIVVFPLFPQYASATTGSVAEKVMEIVSGWEVVPSIEFINTYHTDAGYLDAFASKIERDLEKYAPGHVLFSYHGIPERHLKNIQRQNEKQCSWPRCQCEVKAKDKPYCYRSACFKTSELLAQRLGLDLTDFSTSFQSRLGKDPWIQPYTDESIERLAKNGIKNLLVVSPSFVADCLETTLEIGEEYRDLFLEKGGKTFHFTESLNDDDQWVQAVFNMIKPKIGFYEKNRVNQYNDNNVAGLKIAGHA